MPTSLRPRVSRNIFSVLGTKVIGAAWAELSWPKKRTKNMAARRETRPTRAWVIGPPARADLLSDRCYLVAITPGEAPAHLRCALGTPCSIGIRSAGATGSHCAGGAGSLREHSHAPRRAHSTIERSTRASEDARQISGRRSIEAGSIGMRQWKALVRSPSPIG